MLNSAKVMNNLMIGVGKYPCSKDCSVFVACNWESSVLLLLLFYLIHTNRDAGYKQK